ncbi:hypothetical protein ACHWQZ_G017844 [Mnemiopsis leidyi]
MLTHRGRARLLNRDKNEEIINTQIKLLQQFRPFVRSLLPDSCVTCEKCRNKKLLEQEQRFQDMVHRVNLGQKMSSHSVLPDISPRCKSAGAPKKINKESRLNPRLVLKRV